MNKTRVAFLGTLGELHKRPIRYDLAELVRIVAETQPDLLGVEVERNELERDDLAGAPVEVREAFIPIARRSDTVVVPLGAASNAELRASRPGISARLISGLDLMLAQVQQIANDAPRVNSPLVSHTCGLICHLEERVCGEAGRQAWVSTNETMLANILAMVQRDPTARTLVAVQCRRKHWLEPKLRILPEIELVNYWEL